jgi:hypothetical protein
VMCCRARAESWQDRNPDKVKAIWVARRSRVTEADKPIMRHRVRDATLKHKYGIRHSDYERMLAEQGGVCAICGTTAADSRKKYLCVDHCHKTGRVRGLLCTKCNVAIGNADDSPERLRSMISYLGG